MTTWCDEHFSCLPSPLPASAEVREPEVGGTHPVAVHPPRPPAGRQRPPGDPLLLPPPPRLIPVRRKVPRRQRDGTLTHAGKYKLTVADSSFCMISLHMYE